MRNRIEAVKVSDGWVVEIIDRQHLHHEDDVRRLIYQEHLTVQSVELIKGETIKIVAT